DVRPSVLGHMKPEIVRRCHLEGQFIVVATIAANEHFAPFELGRTKTFRSNILSGMLRLLTVGGWNGGMFASGQLTGDRQPCIPVFDTLQFSGLFLQQSPASGDLGELLRNYFLG